MKEEVIDDIDRGIKNGGLPMFLSTLTVFTFTISSILLIKNVWMFSKLEDTKIGAELALRIFKRNPLVQKQMANSLFLYEHGTLLYVGGAVVCVLCIMGAVLMRKKSIYGYYLYTFSTIAFFASLVAIIGFLNFDAMIYMEMFFSITFIIMYSVNLKHLK